MTDLNALAERLERHCGLEDMALNKDLRQAAQALRGMGEALEPFALAADNMDGDEPDSLFIYDSPESTMISYGDLRRARSALKERGGGE